MNFRGRSHAQSVLYFLVSAIPQWLRAGSNDLTNSNADKGSTEGRRAEAIRLEYNRESGEESVDDALVHFQHNFSVEMRQTNKHQCVPDAQEQAHWLKCKQLTGHTLALYSVTRLELTKG